MKHQRFREVAEAEDLPTFERLIVNFGHDLGFGIATAMMVHDRPGADVDMRVVGNMPTAYLEGVAREELAQNNPVFKRLKTMNVPIVYDQELFVQEGATDLWDYQATFGFKTGVAVALHLPSNRHFLLGFDREERLPDKDEQLTQLLASLQLLAVHAQDAAFRLFKFQELPGGAPALTRRELEVLRWAMNGKTAEVTGQILSLSENTVNFHIRNIMRKLETSSKHQAVLKAIQLGLL